MAKSPKPQTFTVLRKFQRGPTQPLHQVDDVLEVGVDLTAGEAADLEVAGIIEAGGAKKAPPAEPDGGGTDDDAPESD